MLRVCIASIQNVKRSLLLLVVSASDIPLRAIKFFSVLFSLAYSSMLQAVTNKHSLVRRRLLRSTLHGRRWLFLSLRSSHVQQSIDSQWCVADCVIYSASSSIIVFGTSRPCSNLRQPAIRPESRFLPILYLHSTPPLGGSRRNIATPFSMEELEWCGYPTVKKFRRYVYSFWHDPRT